MRRRRRLPLPPSVERLVHNVRRLAAQGEFRKRPEVEVEQPPPEATERDAPLLAAESDE